MGLVKMTLPITTRWKVTITKMKFNEIAARILSVKEGEFAKIGPDAEDSIDSEDSHLERVYNAVKDGEWTFEDFKDFVSVVRNEAKIRAGE